MRVDGDVAMYVASIDREGDCAGKLKGQKSSPCVSTSIPGGNMVEKPFRGVGTIEA
jgi:hypothetical protein